MARLSKIYERLYARFAAIFNDRNTSVESDSLTKMLFKLITLAVVSAIVLFAIDLVLIRQDPNVGGVFGDFFGGVLNPIFTFLTFLGLIVTIVIQRQDLRLSRVEYEKTAEALATQSVENTFFNLLDLHHKIAENLKFDLSTVANNSYLTNAYLLKHLKPHEVASDGRAVFDAIIKYLSADAASPLQIKTKYLRIQESHNHVLGHYFRNLYQAMKFIDGFDEGVVSRSRKFKYASILRAQLSTKELVLLFINCLDGVCDKGQFKNLLVRYAMLEHLPCKITDAHCYIGGGEGLRVDRKMVIQYAREKTFKTIDLVKTYGGAFGKNPSIPYDLARRLVEDE